MRGGFVLIMYTGFLEFSFKHRFFLKIENGGHDLIILFLSLAINDMK